MFSFSQCLPNLYPECNYVTLSKCLHTFTDLVWQMEEAIMDLGQWLLLKGHFNKKKN